MKLDSGYINLAIGIGPTCWSPWVESHGKNYGGRVENNTLGPGKIGYGIGISGAKDWTVHGNRIEFGTNFTGSTATPGFNSSPPTAFLVDDRFVTFLFQFSRGFLTRFLLDLLKIVRTKTSSFTVTRAG